MIYHRECDVTLLQVLFLDSFPFQLEVKEVTMNTKIFSMMTMTMTETKDHALALLFRQLVDELFVQVFEFQMFHDDVVLSKHNVEKALTLNFEAVPIAVVSQQVVQIRLEDHRLEQHHQHRLQ